MKFNLRHIAFSLHCIVLWGCAADERHEPAPPAEEKIRFELFTRADSYGIPVSRAAADEDNLDKTPWILVFNGTNGSATFVEAVQAELIGTKSYVYLTPQSTACQLLALANPQAGFYRQSEGSSTLHAFTKTQLETALAGKTLTQACAELLTVPLATPQVGVPFVSPQQKLAMSALVSVSKIGVGITIPTINLGRNVGKLVVKSSAPDFVLKGITVVMNTPRQAQLHNLDGTLTYNTGIAKITEYHTDASYTADLAPATLTSGVYSTVGNPVYLYESDCDESSNNTYVIIRATYAGEDLFYKMAFVDNGRNQLDIRRNYEYTFTITAVNGRGYSSVADAVKSRPSNTNLDYTVLVQDNSGYEIMANNDYYLGVTNSHFELYAVSDTSAEYVAFTLVTDCATAFPDKNYIKSLTPGITVKTTANSSQTTLQPGGVIPLSTAPCDVVISVADSFTGSSMVGQIEIHLGSLKKIVTVRRFAAVRAPVYPNTTVISDFMPGGPGYLSAYIVDYPLNGDGTPVPTNWLRLSPDGTTVRNDPHHIYVDNGLVYLLIQRNSGGMGVVYVTTKSGEMRRSKVHITHQIIQA
ncbi:hypothetical protein [uncultured Alistipes sp.]|jgi:hypothetical protein|uniref:hypothetical protein n=1 Tax=uncultured Alistipes sp. TaxID=538949 RepID=UPI0025FBC3FA|nr:hypothetical protein [uncultured Alistipes sp.]